MGFVMFKARLWNGKEVYTNYVQEVNVNTIRPFYLEILRYIKNLRKCIELMYLLNGL